MKPLQLLATGVALLLNAHGLFGQTPNMQKVRKDKNGNVAFAEFAPESTPKRLAEGELQRFCLVICLLLLQSMKSYSKKVFLYSSQKR